MGYMTVKVIFDTSADELEAQFKRHTSLYRSREAYSEVKVRICAGTHCAAIYSPSISCPPRFLDPLGHQLAKLWMDVRYQDGDSWDLSCYTGFEHELSHSVNPWPHDPAYEYQERGIRYRIDKLCKLLPQFDDAMRPYLLLWKYPRDLANTGNLEQRKGKAREADQFEYGDARQYLDFLACFGVDIDKPQHSASVRL